MAVTTAIVAGAVAVGATAAAGATSAKGASKAAAAYDSVVWDPKGAAQAVNNYMPVAFGGGDSYEQMQRLANENTVAALKGDLSPGAKDIVMRQALDSGAVHLGQGAVDQLYSGYLGLAAEDLAEKGADRYQSLFDMYQTATMGEASARYTADLNKADARAAGIAGKYNARAGIFSGIAGIAGSVLGAAVGPAMGGGGGGGGLFGGGGKK